MRVQLRTRSTRVRVTYLTKTQRRHVRLVRVSQGRAATTLPRGARATTARALATKKLRSSLTTPVLWKQTTPPTQDPTTPTAAPRIQDPTTAPPTQNPSGVWRPAPGTSWQWQITGAVDESLDVAMYDIDLFDAQPSASSYTVPGFGTVTVPKGENAGAITRLKAKGKVVICYLDTGAWEDYRPDAALFPAAVIGNTTGWSGEKWLDIRPAAWPSFKPLIEARLDLATRSGCDGVEPDQNNPSGNNPGFDISLADQKAWYLEVARMAHARGLSVGQKNGIETTDADTIAAFDWNLNEECNHVQRVRRPHRVHQGRQGRVPGRVHRRGCDLRQGLPRQQRPQLRRPAQDPRPRHLAPTLPLIRVIDLTKPVRPRPLPAAAGPVLAS